MAATRSLGNPGSPEDVVVPSWSWEMRGGCEEWREQRKMKREESGHPAGSIFKYALLAGDRECLAEIYHQTCTCKAPWQFYAITRQAPEW